MTLNEEYTNYIMNKIFGYEPSFDEKITLRNSSNDATEYFRRLIFRAMILSSLHEQELDVLFYRFGISTNCAATLEETGANFNISRERIRQIEAKALRKIRNPIFLKEFLPNHTTKEDFEYINKKQNFAIFYNSDIDYFDN